MSNFSFWGLCVTCSSSFSVSVYIGCHLQCEWVIEGHVFIHTSCNSSKHGEHEVWCHPMGRVHVPYFVGSSEKEVNLEIVKEEVCTGWSQGDKSSALWEFVCAGDRVKSVLCMGGSRCITLLILNFGTGGRYVVRFIYQLLYAKVNTSQCPLNRSVHGL